MRRALLLLLALLAGCAPEPPPAPVAPQRAAVAPLAAWQGSSAGQNEPSQQVLRDAAGWQELWRLIGAPAPQDFPADAVAVAIFLGDRPTGGYAVLLAAESEPGGDLTVTWQEEPPAPEMMVAQAVTQPWSVALYPAPAGQLWLQPDF